jgi:hypothetical protein
MKKHRINAHPARRIYRKIVRIESGLRQKAFGSCDLIMEGETGDAKSLTPSALAPPARSGALAWLGPLGTTGRPLVRHRGVAAI